VPTIIQLLQNFDSVSLTEIDEVKLMNRIDRKYWFHIKQLEAILTEIVLEYDVLEINGHRLMEYRSAYYDTPDNQMYIKHHNRKLNRHKVRRRSYLITGDDFFEIKLKTNKRRTIKKRISTNFKAQAILEAEKEFLAEKTSFISEELNCSLHNHFKRITLIHKDKLDRCTIDIQPRYWNKHGEIGFENLVIFELKRGRNIKYSPMVSLLRKHKIRQRGLSKYCTGRSFLEPDLKRNIFKPRLRFIEKYILN
jgi:hypothetical protein